MLTGLPKDHLGNITFTATGQGGLNGGVEFGPGGWHVEIPVPQPGDERRVGAAVGGIFRLFHRFDDAQSLAGDMPVQLAQHPGVQEVVIVLDPIGNAFQQQGQLQRVEQLG